MSLKTEPTLRRSSSRARAVLAVSAAALLLAISQPAQACVGCRAGGDVVDRTEPTTVVARTAFSWGVLFMLGMVTALGGGMGVYMRRTVQRLDRRDGTDPSDL